MAEPRARYIVGIDLGTTHTVVACAELARGRGAHEDEDTPPPRPPIDVFRIPQLVAPGEVEARPLLPSFRYHPAEGELSAEDLAGGHAQVLPELPTGVVGTLAQRLGGRVPGRLIASAKSWLSHGAVDREAPILPWGAPDEVPKVSPVAASASYLAHVRASWDQAHPEAPLAEQEVVLTVPASFDEAARALTVQAAHTAGLPRVRLLEEPQAAFYDWLDRRREDLEAQLAGTRLLVVVDVGGGTTDLTLIRVEQRKSGIRLTRVAVGEHLMLGGDNMDLTLARLCEPALCGEGQQLPPARFNQLVQQCREAKEELLRRAGPDKRAITVLGGGSRLIGGTLRTELTRDRVLEVVLEGFVPQVGPDEHPERRRTALLEFGLPYAADAAITKHLAQFFARHRDEAAEALDANDGDGSLPLPDSVLLNGGVFRGERLTERLLSVLGEWRGAPLTHLDNPDPELAVARGAAAYGLARRGVGLRIGGGSARSYFVQLEGEGETPRGVCVLPRGSEEGEEVRLEGRPFALRVGEPVRFGLWASASERGAKAGDVVPLREPAIQPLPAIAAVLEGGPEDGDTLPVYLSGQLTEVGTLEISCIARDAPQRRYKLEFSLRGRRGAPASTGETRVTQLHPRFAEARELIRNYYGKSNKTLEGKKIKTLRTDLEKLLGERESWDTALLRELFGELLAGAKRRRRSADHERLWFSLSGYCLRPGFGYPLDDWRIEQLWPLFDQGVQFAPEAAVWSQWWIMWRRVAGGLSEARQTRILDVLAFYLEPEGKRPRKRPKGPRMQGFEDMVQLASALERVPSERKVQVGEWLLSRLEQKNASSHTWWALGRLGARVPLYGSAHTVVPKDVAAAWLERALGEDLSRVGQAALAAAQLARRSGDRQRDLDEALRERAAEALSHSGAHDAWVRLIREGGELEQQEQRQLFGDSLPSGLRELS